MGADEKRREARKRKFRADILDRPQNTDTRIEDIKRIASEPPAKKIKQNASTSRSSRAYSVDNDDTGSMLATTDAVAEGQTSAPVKVQRFIVFIGNLPYTATDDSINNHFAKVRPKSIRHRTDKTSGKSKGFAFLEFEGYDRMKTCLSIFHGSDFGDGISPARKINVELTVGGGGGKSKDRRSKLREKNTRLREQRARKALEEQKQERKSSNKKLQDQEEAGSCKEKNPHSRPEIHADHVAAVNNGDIHPSRRSRMAT